MKSVTNQQVVVVGQQNQSFPWFGLLLIVGVVAHFFWHIVIVVLIVFVAFVLWLLFSDHQLRAREISARADEQNRLFLAGDPRGIYGVDDEGFEQR